MNIIVIKIWNGGIIFRLSIYFKLFRESINNWELVFDVEIKWLDNGIILVIWEDI